MVKPEIQEGQKDRKISRSRRPPQRQVSRGEEEGEEEVSRPTAATSPSLAPACAARPEANRRDLTEFGTDLRRETEVLREAAARVARDLSSSAHALDGLADIVAQGKEALSQAAAAAGGGPQLRALQADPATFTSDPEDDEDFAAWSKGFILDEKEEEIEALCYDSDALEAMADRLVPDAVPREVFWPRLVPDILVPYARSATAMLGQRPRRTLRSPSSSRGDAG
eukprot:XP_020407841.1 BSD domain-containing protein 1-like [Zea mays]